MPKPATPQWPRRCQRQPLVLNLDTTGGAWGKSRPRLADLLFAKIDIQLVVRATDFNRFQDKLKKRAVRLITWAGTPLSRSENFFFLLDGAEQGRRGGENAANYQNSGVLSLPANEGHGQYAGAPLKSSGA